MMIQTMSTMPLPPYPSTMELVKNLRQYENIGTLYIQNHIRNWQLQRGRFRWPIQSLFHPVYIKPDAVVGMMSDKSLSKRGNFLMSKLGSFQDGDWDQTATALNQCGLYLRFKQHFVDQVPWEELADFKQLNSPEQQQAFLTRGRQIDELFVSLKEHGCQWSPDILRVNIGRDGQVIRNSRGLHRLILLQILGQKTMPAYIHVIHKEFDMSQLDKIVAAPKLKY